MQFVALWMLTSFSMVRRFEYSFAIFLSNRTIISHEDAWFVLLLPHGCLTVVCVLSFLFLSNSAGAKTWHVLSWWICLILRVRNACVSAAEFPGFVPHVFCVVWYKSFVQVNTCTWAPEFPAYLKPWFVQRLAAGPFLGSLVGIFLATRICWIKWL